MTAGGSTVAAERSELLAAQRRRPQSRLELERSRLQRMEARLARFGAECRTASPETVEAQRQLVAQLEAGEEREEAARPLTMAERAEAARDARGAVYRPGPITWLREPALIPGTRAVKLLGWDPAVCGRPAWLPADAEVIAA